MLKTLLVAMLTSLAIGYFTYLSSRAKPVNSGIDHRFRITPAAYLSIIAGFVLVIGSLVLMYMASQKSEYLLTGLLFILSFLAELSLVWFFFIRVIYWNDEGVGMRGVMSPRFIRWQEIDHAGVEWDSSFVIRSGSAKIRYSTFDGGYVQLNQAILDRAPKSAVKFGDLAPTGKTGA